MSRHALRLVLFVLACLPSGSVGASPWQGGYYQRGKPGNAVEFHDDTFCIRTHEGSRVLEAQWTEEDGVRIVHSCCQEFRFRRGDGDTLLDAEGTTWDRTPPTWPLQHLKRAPLHIQVTDEDTGEPVTNFLYRYWLSSPEGEEYPPWVAMQRVCNTSGTVVVEAPLTCELGLKLDALDYQCYGSGYETHAFDIVSTNKARLVTARIERGLTVDGVVLDADTETPVTGARVAPLIEYHPCEQPNRHREVVTDEAGRFCVHAVSGWRGIEVEHVRYGVTEHRNAEEWDRVGEDRFRRRTVIWLREANRVAGKVIDRGGGPMAGVSIVSYNGRRTSTDRDGEFEVYGANGYLTVSLPHYIKQEVKLAAGMTNLSVVLDPQFRLVGCVVTPGGEPVTNFTVATRDGPYDGDCWEKSETFRNAEGRFELEVSCPITNLVAVHANGFALTHAAVILDRPPRPVEVVMHPGVAVGGMLLLPSDHIGTATVSLTPQREGRFWRATDGTPGWVDGPPVASEVTGGSAASKMGTRTATVGEGGRYRFDHVTPGSYTFEVGGDGIIGEKRTVRIPVQGRVLPTLSVRNAENGTGTVRGRVYHPCPSCAPDDTCELRPWAFADGKVVHAGVLDMFREGIPFKADEKGDYCVTKVPAGTVSVSVHYNITFDIIGTLMGTGTVHVGETTVIDVLPDRMPMAVSTEKRGSVTATVVAGDGGEADFLAGAGNPAPSLVGEEHVKPPEWAFVLHRIGEDFQERHESPLCYTSRWFAVTNLVAGKYRAELADSNRKWGQDILWTSTEPLTIAPATNLSLAVSLPANSVRGIVSGPQYGWAADVYLIDEMRARSPRETVPLENGPFLMRFVPDGQYSLLAYEDDIGWLIRTGLVVRGACDVGALVLRPGTRLTTRLLGDWVRLRSKPPYRVEITHTKTGITLDRMPDSGENGGTAVFENLWPGEWHVVLLEAGRTVFSTNLALSGVQPITVDMAWSEETARGFVGTTNGVPALRSKMKE